MTILYYDTTTQKADELINTLQQVREACGDQVLAIPKNYDILLNCSADQLLSIRTVIDTALMIMMQKHQEQQPVVEKPKEETNQNIIKLSDYLQ